MRLGFISERYESAGRGPGTISPFSDDPGGKSYGIYQFSESTLLSYVNQSQFEFKAKAFTDDFDSEWIGIANKYSAEFALDQHIFTTKRLYLPHIIGANIVGYSTWSRKIQEAVFSISVQHGGAAEIIKNGHSPDTVDVVEQVKGLYRKRWEYVKKLHLSDRLKNALQNRYQSELVAVLNIEELNYEFA